jgi:hypothetical protein
MTILQMKPAVCGWLFAGLFPAVSVLQKNLPSRRGEARLLRATLACPLFFCGWF